MVSCSQGESHEPPSLYLHCRASGQLDTAIMNETSQVCGLNLTGIKRIAAARPWGFLSCSMPSICSNNNYTSQQASC